MNIPTCPALGIAGLPERFGRLVAGRVYGVAVGRTAMRAQLLAGALHETLGLGTPVLLVAAPDPWRAALPQLQPYRQSGRLRELDAVALAQRVRSEGVGAAVDLVAAGLPRIGGLVLLERAAALLCTHDAPSARAASQCWRAWADAGERVVLALLDETDAAEPGQAPPEGLVLDGFARVHGTGRRTMLEMHHWNGEPAERRRAAWLLRSDARRDAIGQPRLRAVAPARPADEVPLVATRRAAQGFPPQPAGWRIVDGWAGAVHAARGMHGGSIVLHFQRTQDFRTLARAVAAVRTAGSTAPAVLVRETGGQLRIAQQVALLRLGASLIVSQQARAAHVRLAAERFAALPKASLPAGAADADRVVSEVDAALAGGACTPPVFRSEIERLLAGTGDELQHTLLRLDTAGLGIERLADIGTRRARDALACEHAQELWLFLFGCAAEQADDVLARLYGARFERLFAQRTLHAHREEMRRVLAAFPR